MRVNPCGMVSITATSSAADRLGGDLDLVGDREPTVARQGLACAPRAPARTRSSGCCRCRSPSHVLVSVGTAEGSPDVIGWCGEGCFWKISTLARPAASVGTRWPVPLRRAKPAGGRRESHSGRSSGAWRLVGLRLPWWSAFAGSGRIDRRRRKAHSASTSGSRRLSPAFQPYTQGDMAVT